MSDQVVIVGPGRMGLAMGAALTQVGAVRRLVFFGRELEPPPHPLFDAGSHVAEYRIGPGPVPEGTTIVLVTHEPDIAEHAGRIITFGDGRILSDRRKGSAAG